MRCSGWNGDSNGVLVLLLWLMLDCREDAQQVINMGLRVAMYYAHSDAAHNSDTLHIRWK